MVGHLLTSASSIGQRTGIAFADSLQEDHLRLKVLGTKSEDVQRVPRYIGDLSFLGAVL